MATTQDFTDTLKDMMGAWQMDQAKFEEAWKSSTGFGEKASGIALDAAGLAHHRADDVGAAGAHGL